MARSTRTIKVKALWGREATALREEYNKLVAEMDELKTQFVALAEKLDADAGVTDVNYASTLTLAATEAKKVQ